MIQAVPRPLRIKQSYINRCRNYVQWLGIPMFEPDESLPHNVSDGLSALECMYLKETHGINQPCREPHLFDCLKKGKQCREFDIKQWMSGIKNGEFWPEEFFGCAGVTSVGEFRSIFGRTPTRPLLQRIRRELMQQLEQIELT